MKKTDVKRLKRTLTALLLVFVFSFGPAFADTETTGGTEPGGVPEVTGETPVTGEGGAEVSGDTQQEAPATAETPQAETPAPKPVSHIIKKGKYYYYKYSNGKIRKKKGFVTDCGKKYYIRKGGRIRTSKSFRIKKKYYRANKKGVILTGIYKWKGKYNYSNAAGQWKKSEGFVKWKGGKYFVKKGGTVVMKGIFIAKNIPYKADGKGGLKTIVIPDGDDPVIAVAREQVGIMTGKTYWRWYFHTKFRDTDRTPWCGAFVAWCYNEAGLYDKVTGVKSFGNLGYVPSYTRYANKHKLWINRADAKGGDIIIFGSSRHVGLVEGIYGNYIFTIEGNAGPTAAFGCGKAGAVCRKMYKTDYTGIKGIIRVK